MESSELSRSVIIIIGAAQGIGKAIETRVLRENWQVIATDKNKDHLNELFLLNSGSGGFRV